MKVLYYDCFSGISGDMNLGAMVDLGVDPNWLIEELNKLPIRDSFRIRFEKQQKSGITGTKAIVEELGHEHVHRHLKDVEEIIEGSTLDHQVKTTAKDIFYRVAQAEGKVHGKSPESVHFHEVGAIDSIVDIVGAALCFYYWKVDKIYGSPIQVGGGMVQCAHGWMPVPAPATAEILKGFPIKSGLVEGEATTPTGAAIVSHGVDEFVTSLDLNIEKIGYGLGTKDFSVPNVLRIFLGELNGAGKEETQKVLEVNLDDMNPEFTSFVEEKLFEAGALDVYKTPIIMKKGRPGVKITVLCASSKEEAIKRVLFAHTTTLGIRGFAVEKTMLDRRFMSVQTTWGPVDVKVGLFEGKPIKHKPEYEQCAAIGRAHDLELTRIYDEIRKRLEEFHDLIR